MGILRRKTKDKHEKLTVKKYSNDILVICYLIFSLLPIKIISLSITFFKLIVIQIYETLHYLLALLYNFTSGKKYIPSCGRDESKTSFPLQEGIFVCSRVLLHHDQ